MYQSEWRPFLWPVVWVILPSLSAISYQSQLSISLFFSSFSIPLSIAIIWSYLPHLHRTFISFSLLMPCNSSLFILFLLKFSLKSFIPLRTGYYLGGTTARYLPSSLPFQPMSLLLIFLLCNSLSSFIPCLSHSFSFHLIRSLFLFRSCHIFLEARACLISGMRERRPTPVEMACENWEFVKFFPFC